jgi:hypothetical protein
MRMPMWKESCVDLNDVKSKHSVAENLDTCIVLKEPKEEDCDESKFCERCKYVAIVRNEEWVQVILEGPPEDVSNIKINEDISTLKV